MSALTNVLLNLFIIYTAAKLAGSLFARAGQPAVIGELLAGVLIGPHALGLIGTPFGELLTLFNGDHVQAEHALELVLESFAELGVIVLLFTVGLETRATDLLRVGGRAVAVGVLGVVAPFVAGFMLMRLTEHPTAESAFVATALVATSVGITARVLQEAGVLRSREARIILGAAVIDDVLALLLLSVVSASTSGAGVSAFSIAFIAIQATAFIGFIAWAGTHMTRRYSVHLERLDEIVPLNLSLFLMLGLALASAAIGLAAIIGAFLAGMVLAESREQFRLEHQARPLSEFVTPFFFVFTGSRVDLQVLADPQILAMAVAITLLAIVTKVVGAGAGMWGSGRWSMTAVGIGMAPRGEVGLIIAGIGFARGIIPADLFAVVVVMSIATTLVVPPLLSLLYKGRRPTAVQTPLATFDEQHLGVDDNLAMEQRL